MKVQLNQAIKQTISQKMIQSAHVLQLSTAELRHYLEDLALENPLMEFIQQTTPNAYVKESVSEPDEQNYVYDRQEQADSREVWDSGQTGTLSDALMFQLGGMVLGPDIRRILIYMIYNLDANGYLSVSKENIRLVLDCKEDAVSDALAILQDMEPYGVGARNLSECLCIQLQRLYPEEQTAAKIAENELVLLGKNQLPVLARKLHRPLNEILHACEIIRSLNPRPGAGYSDGNCVSYIVPELLVFQENGRFHVTLNETQPLSVQINSSYLQMLHDCDAETAAYLEQK
ncbi:MAG: hypothetical protein Q4F81_07525 [Eubacteriales bacterium]|nr:hypothetical protein [Eubacteriales bacterium]